MSYIFDYKDTLAYDTWYNSPYNKLAVDHQFRLLKNLLRPSSGDSIIDIGCGTGETLKKLSNLSGLQLTGLDSSPYMLDFAHKKNGDRVDFHRGFAEDLPFEDNSFNHACLITTLEYVGNPRKVLEEAARVSKDRLFIGVMNKYAILSMQRKFKGLFEESVYNRAQFFSIWELKRMVATIMGRVPVSWRTVNLFPLISGPVAHRIEEATLVQKNPFGTFVGMVVTLEPRFRIRPLPLQFANSQKQNFAESHYKVVKENENFANKG